MRKLNFSALTQRDDASFMWPTSGQPMPDPTLTGERVLKALAAGRAKAIRRRKTYSSFMTSLVIEAARRDHGPRRGLPKRIALILHGSITERGVRNILARLFSRSDSVMNDTSPLTGDVEQ